MKTFIHAARIITRMKAYSIICVLGLVISLAGTLTLVRYIHQEFTVDWQIHKAATINSAIVMKSE